MTDKIDSSKNLDSLHENFVNSLSSKLKIDSSLQGEGLRAQIRKTVRDDGLQFAIQSLLDDINLFKYSSKECSDSELAKLRTKAVEIIKKS